MQNRMTVKKSDIDFNVKSVIDYVKTPVIAVVKCNGYGISMEYAIKAWYENGVRFFAVSEPIEALQIRELGYSDVDILLMSPVYDEDILKKLLQNNVILTVTSKQCAMTATSVGDYNVRAHVKVETGMGRFGAGYDAVDELEAIYNVKGIKYEGIFSHFALSFEKEYNQTKVQLDKFLQAVKHLQDRGIDVGMRHIANSCAAIRFPDTRLDAVRVGSALVGRLITKTALPLRKVGFMEADVVDITTLKKGQTSGYSMLYRAKSDVTAAVISLGYRQGLGLTRQNDSFRFIDVIRSVYHDIRGYKKQPVVKINGKSYNVLGRVGNQYTLIDVSGSDVRIGDKAVCDVNVLMVDTAVERALI
ncbi:MAG: alanine racemase [Clostridia bacterium]|nr:alanine racemase [Clostridia bacterium]